MPLNITYNTTVQNVIIIVIVIVVIIIIIITTTTVVVVVVVVVVVFILSGIRPCPKSVCYKRFCYSLVFLVLTRFQLVQ
jgi:hypothetical protein